jgi:two-component system, OmpR family, phosphate regulon sensor histidine kinase PhoR
VLGTSSTPTRWTNSLVAQFLAPALAALGVLGATAGLYCVWGPGNTADAGSVPRPAEWVLLGFGAALAAGAAMAWWLSSRLRRRVQRLVGYAELVAVDAPTPYLGPEQADEVGQLEARLADMAHRTAATIATLRVEQERQNAILSAMVEGVIVTDLDDAAMVLNARARELLAVPPATDPRGRSLIELVRDPSIGEILRELTDTRQTVSRTATVGDRTLQVNAARLAGTDDRPIGAVLVLHDVTELRRLENVRRDFVANVSHELRTPLTAIKGFAETLLGPAGGDAETRQRFLTVIDRHSERLGRLIDDLLALSDLELGRIPMRMGAVAVGPVIDDVVQICAERARRGGVTVRVQLADPVPVVRADGDRLRQVLINLLDNAIKYTAGGGRVVIRAQSVAAPGPPMVAIAIEDSGVGIPPHDLPRLTERFFRVDKARSRDVGGTGLGLAIVKHLVQAHGGTLGIASTYGEGTKVTVQWPAAAPIGEGGGVGGGRLGR